jgi:hypothetical protein
VIVAVNTDIKGFAQMLSVRFMIQVQFLGLTHS